MPQMHVSLEPNPTAADREAVLAGLRAFNRRHSTEPGHEPLAFVLRDGAGTVQGGLLAETAWHWLHIEILWIADALRGQGWGRRLMETAEAAGRARGCRGAYLDTFGFQAPGFYEKLGYVVFGVLEDYPPGSRRIFLHKRLD
jgi:ribosomal protein S18 acetylase RimI-like enzyme